MQYSDCPTHSACQLSLAEFFRCNEPCKPSEHQREFLGIFQEQFGHSLFYDYRYIAFECTCRLRVCTAEIPRARSAFRDRPGDHDAPVSSHHDPTLSIIQ